MAVQRLDEPDIELRLIERRKRRLVPAPCTACESPRTGVVSRTSRLLYVRCADCGWVSWATKPGIEPVW